jgi:hypothetical protein
MSDEIKQYVGQYLERELKVLVHEKVQAEEELRFRQLKWIAIFIGLIGLGSIGTVAKNMIDQSVQEEIEKATAEISQAMGFLSLLGLSLGLGATDEPASQEDINKVIDALYDLKKDKDKNKYIKTKEFVTNLAQIISYLDGERKSESIDRIFELYEDEVVRHGFLVEPLIRHYGLEILARDVMDETDLRYKTFARLERAADEANVKWRALAYRALYESTKTTDKKSKRVEDIIKQSVFLSDEHRRNFFRVILVNSRAENWVRSKGGAGPSEMHVQKVVLNFLNTYQTTINEVYVIDQLEGWGDAVEQGADWEGAYSLAGRIAKLKDKKINDFQ